MVVGRVGQVVEGLVGGEDEGRLHHEDDSPHEAQT